MACKTALRIVFTAAFAAAALSSPKNRNNPNLSPAEIRFGLSCLGTPEGTRYIMVSPGPYPARNSPPDCFIKMFESCPVIQKGAVK